MVRPEMIVTDAVDAYLGDLRWAADPVLAEIEAHGTRAVLAVDNMLLDGAVAR
jgi:hypothetical protein